jgi:membrane protein implicated in regulation of membrane protease activity
MRGGALPIFAWAALLVLLAAGNWAWAGATLQLATFGFAVLVTLLFAVACTLATRGGAARRGAPAVPPTRRILAVPDISFGAAIAALGVAAVAFGVTFGHFSIYFGCGLFLIGAGRLAVEVRAERRDLERLRTLPQPEDVADREGSEP